MAIYNTHEKTSEKNQAQGLGKEGGEGRNATARASQI